MNTLSLLSFIYELNTSGKYIVFTDIDISYTDKKQALYFKSIKEKQRLKESNDELIL